MSEGKCFTYGFHERQDITAAIDVANAKQADQTFAILGVSAGGTVAISAAARDERIWKVVTIGTFANLGETIEAQTKWLLGELRKRAIDRRGTIASARLGAWRLVQWVAWAMGRVWRVLGEAQYLAWRMTRYFSSFHGFGGLVRMILKYECEMARNDGCGDRKVDRPIRRNPHCFLLEKILLGHS